MRCLRWLQLVLGCTVLAPTATATALPAGSATVSRLDSTVSPLEATGRPRIVLDYLELPAAGAPYRKQLQSILYRETRRVRWGAGTGSTITYRFYVTQLEFHVDGDVLRVTCHATGRLPRGKTAKSTLTFSGPASERSAVVNRVLEIVARGVVTRLAELERIRRGDLSI